MALDWSNEKALEFLELLKTEPCIWNHTLQSHKNRSAVYEAWRRIIDALSFPVTYEELKKKRDSLMGYYRIHLNKYKKSVKSGACSRDEIYSTNWFAFELMDSFLRPIYGIQSNNENEKINDNEIKESVEVKIIKCEEVSNESVEEDCPNWSHLEPSTSTGNFSITSRDIEKLDEYDHFAFMIASKIRKLQNPDDREILMNSIQNIIFEFYMRNK